MPECLEPCIGIDDLRIGRKAVLARRKRTDAAAEQQTASRRSLPPTFVALMMRARPAHPRAHRHFSRILEAQTLGVERRRAEVAHN